MKQINAVRKSTLVTVLILVAGCGALAPKPEPPLFNRLGGKPAIDAVVNDFVDRVSADKRITNETVKTRLASIDISVLKSHVSDMVCSATGGPCEYKGRDMKTAHEGLQISDAEFDYVVEDLVITLDQYSVPEREKKELLSILAPTREDIVEARR